VFDRRTSPLGDGTPGDDEPPADEPLDERRTAPATRDNRAPFSYARMVRFGAAAAVLLALIGITQIERLPDVANNPLQKDTLRAPANPMPNAIAAREVKKPEPKEPEPEESQPEPEEPEPKETETSDAPRTADPEEVEDVTKNEKEESSENTSSSQQQSETQAEAASASTSLPTDAPPEDKVFERAEVAPKPKGGLAAIQKNFDIPAPCRAAAESGRVVVRFVVTSEGEVEDARAVRGIGHGCDEAAVEAVEETTFEPGRQEGTPVNVRATVPVAVQFQ
jgi:protein TonB